MSAKPDLQHGSQHGSGSQPGIPGWQPGAGAAPGTDAGYDQQIMRRLVPMVVLIFVVIGVLAAGASTVDTIVNFQAGQQLIQEQADLELNRSLDEYTRILSGIATGRTLRQYTLTLSTNPDGQTTRAVQIAQAELLQIFDDLLARYRDRFLNLRYLTDDGHAWGEATNTSGNIFLETAYRPYTPTAVAAYNQVFMPDNTEPTYGVVTFGSDISGVITLYYPVRTSETAPITGAIELEVALVPLLNDVETALSQLIAPRVDVSRTLIVDARGAWLYDSEPGESREDLDPVIQEILPLTETTSQLSGLDLIATAPLLDRPGEGLPWRLVLTYNLPQVLLVLIRNLLLLVVLLVVMALLVLNLIQRTLKTQLAPVGEAQRLVNQLSGELQGRVALETLNLKALDTRTGVSMVDALENVTDQVNQLRDRVTREGQRHRRDIEIAARIGRETATRLNMDEVLDQAIELICRELGFYHAQVFLTDDVSAYAVLVRSRGEVGQRLLAQGHKLLVGSETVIGQVTGNNEPVIVNDTRQRTGPHGFNALLPETRAELGLPLSIQNQVIGALDIQSRVVNAFNPDDLPMFRLLADQVALAVNTARLLNETNRQVRQLETLNRLYTRKSWEESDQQTPRNRAFRYNLLDVEATPLDGAETGTNGSGGGGLALPISLRGEVIGTLNATANEGQSFTEGDAVILRAVADRVALAIENARLFQETQVNLAETSVLYRLNRFLNEASTLDDILQALLVSVMQDADGAQIAVFDDYIDQPEWLEIVSDLAMGDRDPGSESLIGTRLNLAEYPFLRRLRSNQVTLIHDTRSDSRLDPGMQLIFRRIRTRTVVLIPLNVRGEWRGLISVEYGEPREFNEREGRVFSALIDQAGVAIDNRLLLEQTEDARNLSENLYSASRIINTMSGYRDLIHAIVITSTHRMDYQLVLLEGELSESGSPTVGRVVAESRGTSVFEVERTFTLNLPADAPVWHRDPVILTDEPPYQAKYQGLYQMMRDEDYRFLAIFPLFSSNVPIALFYAYALRPIEFTERDEEVLRAITGQMSTQLENRRLLRQTEVALDESRRLYAASRAISSAQDARAVYHAAVQNLASPYMELTGEHERLEISILLTREFPRWDSPSLEVVYNWATPHKPVQVFREGAIIESTLFPVGRLLLETNQPVYIRDTTHDASAVASGMLSGEAIINATLRGNSAGSAIIVPIQYRQKWFGVILCQHNQFQAFDPQTIRFTAAIADQVALAVENRLLFEEAQIEAHRAQDEARRALTLAETARLANQVGLDFEERLDEVLGNVAEVGGYDRYALYLLDERTGMLNAASLMVPQSGRLLQAQHPLNDETPVAVVATTGRPLTINDISRYPLPEALLDELTAAGESVAAAQAQFGKCLINPVQNQGRVVGVLVIGHGGDLDDLDEGDAQLAGALASQIAVALENRRLFRQAQSEQQTLRSTLETLPAGVVVLQPQTLVPTLENDQALQYLGEPLRNRLPFTAENYRLYRTGTQLNYPNDELPVMIARDTGITAFNDDVAVIDEGFRVDLLVNAAPILNASGEVEVIIATFSDISNLRSLENTLQENLRETVSVSNAQAALTAATTIENVLDTAIMQLMILQAGDGYLLLLDEHTGALKVAGALMLPLDDPALFEGLLDDHSVLHSPARALRRLPEAQQAALADRGIRAVLSAPMISPDRNLPLGWLVAVQTDEDQFALETERIFTSLVAITATTLDNRFLIERTRESLQETDVLYRASTAISRARDEEQLIEALRQSLGSLEPTMMTVFYAVQAFDTHLLVDTEGVDLTLLRAALIRHGIPESGLFISDLNALARPDALEADLLTVAQSMPAAHPIRAIGAMNLRLKEGGSGLLAIVYDQPHRFADSDSRFLSTLADGASVVLDNFALVREIQGTLEETTVLYQANRSLIDATSGRDILNIMVSQVIQPYVDHVFVALLRGVKWESPSSSIVIDASWSQGTMIDLEGVVLSEEQFPAWRLLASPTLTAVEDVDYDPSLTDLERAGINSLNARSLVIIPLRVPNRIIGVMWVSSTQPHRFLDHELRIYQGFGEQSSLSLEATYLLHQTERRARQLETSAEITTSAGTILDLHVLLPQVVNLIQGAFGYDHVQVFLMDDEQEFAEVRASTGEAGRQLLSIGHKLRKGSQSVIGQVTASGRPFIALDTADASVVHQPNPYLPKTRSEVALPLIIKNRVIGALDVQSNQANAFTQDDLQALTILAGQISIAIENARLYEDVQQQADRMSFLFEATTAAAAAQTLTDTLNTVVNSVHDSFNALTVVLYLRRDYKDHNDNVRSLLEAVAVAGTRQPLTEIEAPRLNDSQRLVSLVARRMHPAIVDDIQREPLYLPVSPSSRSAMLVPLISGLNVLGVLVLENILPAQYDQNDLQLMQALSNSVSAIIQGSQLLEQLQKANSELRELDRIKSDFLANMSHELRTPLNSIIGFSRVMLKGIDGPLTEMQEQDLTTIYTSGQHLLGLINDILDQAKIAAGKMDLKKDYFEVKPLIEGVKSIGLGLIKDKPIQLHVEIAHTLPKAYGDEFRTRQVLLNLVSNASKFTNEGTVTIRVYPVENLDEERTDIRVDVIDTGIGIAEQDIPLLFEAFRQVDSSLTRTAGGTGLGLPIARSLIEMQGGRMLVSSQVNVGSTFSVTLPTAPVAEDEKKPDTRSRQDDYRPPTQTNRPATRPTLDTRSVPVPPDIEASTKRITQRLMQIKRQILLIEDNPEMVDQFRRALQRDGYEVLAASIMLEAEAMASGLHPTLIVMDVNFAKGNGWKLLERLKERDDTFDVPVIVVTLSDESERAYQLGAHTFLQRPIDPETLLKAAHDAEKLSHTERILIIDDQPDSIRLLTYLLSEHGNYRIFAADNATEGISLVARRRPDLIILDLRMPEKDGFQVLQELRSNPETAAIPVLVVTGDIDLNSTEQEQLANVRVLFKAGISESDYEDFIQRVNRHLNGEEGL